MKQISALLFLLLIGVGAQAQKLDAIYGVKVATIKKSKTDKVFKD